MRVSLGKVLIFVIAAFAIVAVAGASIFWATQNYRDAQFQSLTSFCLSHMKSSLPQPIPAYLAGTVTLILQDARFVTAENGIQFSYSFFNRSVSQIPQGNGSFFVTLEVIFVHVFSITNTTKDMSVNFSFIIVRFATVQLESASDAVSYQFLPARDQMTVNPPYPYRTICIT